MAWCSFCHTPAACQSRKRRQQVMPLPKPRDGGRFSQGMPVSRTNNIPLSAASSLMVRVLGQPLLDGTKAGINGCSTCCVGSLRTPPQVSAIKMERCPPSAWNRVRDGMEYALIQPAKRFCPSVYSPHPDHTQGQQSGLYQYHSPSQWRWDRLYRDTPTAMCTSQFPADAMQSA